MTPEVFAIYNETKKMWWGQGHLTPDMNKAYLWRNLYKAKKKMEQMDYFYGWSQDGDSVKIATFALSLKSWT